MNLKKILFLGCLLLIASKIFPQFKEGNRERNSEKFYSSRQQIIDDIQDIDKEIAAIEKQFQEAKRLAAQTEKYAKVLENLTETSINNVNIANNLIEKCALVFKKIDISNNKKTKLEYNNCLSKAEVVLDRSEKTFGTVNKLKMTYIRLSEDNEATQATAKINLDILNIINDQKLILIELRDNYELLFP